MYFLKPQIPPLQCDEAKQEKDEPEKYRRLHEFSLTRLQVMLFKIFYNQREMEAMSRSRSKFKSPFTRCALAVTWMIFSFRK